VRGSKNTARSWLNGYAAAQNTNGENYSAAGTNFITKAFTSAEQAKIATTDLTNPANPQFQAIPGGNDTTDKIFYLKHQDVTGEAAIYFTDNESRKAQATDYTVALGPYVNSGYVDWCLRSPGNRDDRVALVTSVGSLAHTDLNAATADRPAFYLNTDDLILKESAGGGYLASAQEDNAFLYSLGADEITLTPAFNSGGLAYNTTVPNATSSFTLSATAAIGVTVDGIGSKSLNVGLNSFGITVIDNNEIKRIYQLNVKRKALASVSTAPTAKQNLTYTGSAQALVTAGSGVTGGTLQYKLDSGNYGTNIPTATNAGDYIVKYKVVATDTENYEDIDEVTLDTITIGKGTASVTTAPSAKTGLKYTGSAQALVTAGSGVTGGTLQYKLDSGNYSTDIPTATNAGDYTVKYKVVATDTANYSDSAEVTLATISIAKKVSSLTTAPTAKRG
jgi:methionine-rich copper-binding protein CopC